MADIAVSPPRESSLAALTKHARYVLSENPVTAATSAGEYARRLESGITGIRSAA